VVQDTLPWLCQGDILEAVPPPELVVDVYGTPKSVLHRACPCLLVTRDCVLDKTNNRGELQIRRLQFLPLRLLAQQEPQRQQVARSRKLNPAEVIYVGDCPTFGEAFCLLSEMFSVPAEYFKPCIQVFDREDADPGGHLTATQNDTRLGRLDTEDLRLFRRKIAYFYLQADLPPEA
jgi:hypothetical protein